MVLPERCARYFCGDWPRDSSIDVLEWLFACPAFGIAVLSSSLVIEPVGLLALVSVPVPGSVVLDDELVEPEVSVVDDEDDVVPVGVLGESVGVPAPVGLFGDAGNGGAADSLVEVDGVTGGTAVVVVELV